MRRRHGSNNKSQNVLFDVNPDVLTASKMRRAWQTLSHNVTPYPTFVLPPGLVTVVAQWAGTDYETSFPKHVLKTVYQDSYSTVPCGVWEPQQPGATTGVCMTCNHTYPSHLKQVKVPCDSWTPEPGTVGLACSNCGHSPSSHQPTPQIVHDEVTVIGMDLSSFEKKVIAELSDDTLFWEKE